MATPALRFAAACSTLPIVAHGSSLLAHSSFRAGRPSHALAAAGPLLGRARQAEAEEGQQEAAPRGRGLAIMPREILFCLFSFCPTDNCCRYFSNVAKTGWGPEWKINVLINMQSTTLNCTVFFIRKDIKMSFV